MINSNNVLVLDLEKYLDVNQLEMEKKLLALDNNFVFINSDKSLIREFSLLGMCDSHKEFQAGHCFFILFEKNVIIYPHGDNTGFGCFAIDKSEESVALDFLKSADQLHSFRSSIEN